MELTPLTPDQQQAMQAGGELAEQLLQLRSGTPEGHDPLAATLTPAAGTELEQQRTNAGFSGCVAAVDVYGNPSPDLWMLGVRTDEPHIKPFSAYYPASFHNGAYAAYRELPVDYVGYINNTTAGTRLDDQAKVYRIEQPDDPDIHHGGIVVGTHMMAMGRADGVPAGDTLYHTAALTQQRVLDNAHEHEPSGDGPGVHVADHLYEPLTPPAILGAKEIRTIGAMIRSLADRGHIMG